MDEERDDRGRTLRNRGRLAKKRKLEGFPMQERIANEICHGRFLAKHGAGEIWNWESHAGKLRWARRVEMIGAHLKPGMTILELGCGAGYFTKELARSGAEIVAVDVSADLLEIAKANCPASNVRYEIQDACALTYSDAAFDSVVGSSILHHLEMQPALRQIHRVLKPGGTICFTEPNMLNPQIAIQKNVPWIKRTLGDSPDETAFFRWPLRRLLEHTGYGEIQIDPFDFLHPKTPVSLINPVNQLGRFLEKLPVISEFAGSLYIRAVKKHVIHSGSEQLNDRAKTCATRAPEPNGNGRELYREGPLIQRRLSILEIGSTSPSSDFHSKASDVLELIISIGF